jgi:hypothetical protein
MRQVVVKDMNEAGRKANARGLSEHTPLATIGGATIDGPNRSQIRRKQLLTRQASGAALFGSSLSWFHF